MVLAGSLANGPDDSAERKPLAANYEAATLVAALDASGGGASIDVEIKSLGPHQHLVATANDPKRGVAVFPEPGAKRAEQRIDRREGAKGPLVFGGLKQKGNWIKVMLPIRPNGSTGWVHLRDVELSVSNWSVEVDLSKKRLTVRRGKKVFKHPWSAGIGQPETPTPTGRFYTSELINPRDKETIYGAFVFVISGYSNKVTSFAGGNGELGIHGTNDPSGLGSDVSHGCIRVNNRAIWKLANAVPLGSPVRIVR